ncbi:MAG: hypothetical protein PQJ46_00225, partial [Spirochaetales bacterium]|nr:hypothetical protein [Spirochaetales bacterium]
MSNTIKINKSTKVLTYAFLIIVTIASLYPIFFSIITSFKTVQDYTFSKTAFPQNWVLDNYSYVFRNMGIARYIFNSIITVGIGLFLYIFICNAAGYAIGMLKFKFKIPVFSFILFF